MAWHIGMLVAMEAQDSMEELERTSPWKEEKTEDAGLAHQTEAVKELEKASMEVLENQSNLESQEMLEGRLSKARNMAER